VIRSFKEFSAKRRYGEKSVEKILLPAIRKSKVLDIELIDGDHIPLLINAIQVIASKQAGKPAP